MDLARHQKEQQWFVETAEGADQLAGPNLKALVFHMLQVADAVGFDFRTEVLKVNGWLAANPGRRPKRCWARFWMGCFNRAKPDGTESPGNYRRDRERFAR